MASYLSTQCTPPTEAIGLSMGVITETFSVVFSANTFVIGDTIALAQIPLNATILSIFMGSSATLGSTSAFSIGDTNTAAKYASAVSFVAAVIGDFVAVGGITPVAASLPSTTYTTQTAAALPVGLVLDPSGSVADFLLLTATAAGGSATSATLRGFMQYTLNKAS